MSRDPEHDAAIADDEILPEYDCIGVVRGKYAEHFKPGVKMVLLDPDVAEVFPNATAVNAALRALAGIIRDYEQRECG
ncbi:MAG: hypothetical protein JO306_07915 [Gemmatimonadetes bacterium]|nr:hypothetical protein [Gemmatimonadota bacterium]